MLKGGGGARHLTLQIMDKTDMEQNYVLNANSYCVISKCLNLPLHALRSSVNGTVTQDAESTATRAEVHICYSILEAVKVSQQDTFVCIKLC